MSALPIPTDDAYAHSERLARLIAENIAVAGGWISFARYMELALHAPALGYPTVGAMIDAMIASEDGQLDAMFRYLAHHELDAALRSKNWAAFARGYNGAGYKKNAYDEKLESAFLHCCRSGPPDLRIRGAQVYLMFHGCHPGPIDGVMGPRTRVALRRFQEGKGLPQTVAVDSATLAALRRSRAVANSS